MWASIASFIVKHRSGVLQILALIVIVTAITFAIDHVLNVYFEKGKAASDAEWIAKYNKDVENKNKRIAELEHKSQEASRRLEEAKDSAQKLVDGLYTEWQAEKAKGKASSKVIVKCPGTFLPFAQSLGNPPEAQLHEISEGGEPLKLQLDTKEIYLPPDYIKVWNEMTLKGEVAR